MCFRIGVLGRSPALATAWSGARNPGASVADGSGYNNAFRFDGMSTGGSCGLGCNISNSLFSMQPGQEIADRYEAQTEDAGNGSYPPLFPGISEVRKLRYSNTNFDSSENDFWKA